MTRIIDLRSDTVTKPTDEMREAASAAEVGDDVFGDDPTVIELEEYAADLLGKKAALFVSSGTQGNIVSILSQTHPGDEIFVESKSHMYQYEVGGMSALGGVIPRPIQSKYGFIPENIIQSEIRPPNIHFPIPKLFCIENTHNGHGGIALSPSEVEEMSTTAHNNGLRVHLDGARLFNASTYHNVDVKAYTNNVDTVQICLSKGLSAPIGSIFAGDEEIIKIARKKRKMLGGGMRQVGIIAAPALVALKDMRDRLVIDHINARNLAGGLAELGLKVWPSQTNIVICDVSEVFDDSKEAVNKLKTKNILIVSIGKNIVRFTTHRHITESDIETTLETISQSWLK